MSAKRAKNFDFDNDTSENILSYPYISCMTNQKLFHSKNYFLEMALSYIEMLLKSDPQELNFVMAKATSKGYTLDCRCIYPHRNAASFSIKTFYVKLATFFLARTIEY